MWLLLSSWATTVHSTAVCTHHYCNAAGRGHLATLPGAMQSSLARGCSPQMQAKLSGEVGAMQHRTRSVPLPVTDTASRGSPSTKRPELGGFWKLAEAAEEKKLRVLLTAFRRSLQAVAQRKSPVQKGGRPSSSRRCDNSEVRAGCSPRMLNGRK